MFSIIVTSLEYIMYHVSCIILFSNHPTALRNKEMGTNETLTFTWGVIRPYVSKRKHAPLKF